jgi:cyclopropane fatty-acyl-phospholipid synthase-like methyltransferase
MHGFGPLSTLFRDAAQAPTSAAEIDWYATHVAVHAGLAIELMCGSGRVLAPLVARGRQVHGVDVSAAMLARCEARLAEAGCSTTLVRQDVTQLNVPFRYGCAMVTAGSFQLITDPAAAAASLSRIRAHLLPPGLLFLDCWTPTEAAQRLGAPLVELRTAALADGTRIALRSETTCWPDARLSRAENRYAHRRGAQLLAEEHETVTHTWYAFEDIAALVKEAGFRDVVIAPSPSETDDTPAFMLTARL